MRVMICRYCGKDIETVTGEHGVYVHTSHGYSICWEDDMMRNAQPMDSEPVSNRYKLDAQPTEPDPDA